MKHLFTINVYETADPETGERAYKAFYADDERGEMESTIYENPGTALLDILAEILVYERP